LLLKPLDPELIGNPRILLHVSSALLKCVNFGVNPHVLLHNSNLLLVSLPLDALLILLYVVDFKLLNLLFHQQLLPLGLVPFLKGPVAHFVFLLDVPIILFNVLLVDLDVLIH
jgi:hypothetical protein